MMKRNILRSYLLSIGVLASLVAKADNHHWLPFSIFQNWTQQINNIDTIGPIEERYGDFVNDPNRNPFDLRDPSIVDRSIEYDPITGQYVIIEKIGDDYFRTPTYMTFEEYLRWRANRQEDSYFDQLAGISSPEKSGSDKDDPVSKVNLANSQDPRVKRMLGDNGRLDPIAKMDLGNKLLDRLFGGTNVEIRPQGNIDLTFGGDYQFVDDPNRPPRARSQGGFDFDMNIQMNVTGQIGEKLKLNASYNTQATFDFENPMKLEYKSDEFSEDDIVKSIEAGNVSLPLKGQLIQGAQSLFGLKTELQFGYLRLTMLASQQKSKREQLQIQGGGQIQQFNVPINQYDENRHFFISHYNRNNFEGALKNMPQVNSQMTVANIQVWVTNDRNQPNNTRDLIAFTDFGEYDRLTASSVNPKPGLPHPDIFGQQELPTNYSNDLYERLLQAPQTRYIDNAVSVLQGPTFQMQQGKDFEKFRGRKLEPSEYSFNPDLGFLSLNINLRPDQVLGVAYEYTYNGQTAAKCQQYKVGEFDNDSNIDSSKVLYIKLLKSTTQNVALPMWDLMMKNVYNVGAYQANPQDFKLDIYYETPGEGERRFLPLPGLAEVPLLRFFNLDNLNSQRDPQPDGQFDFVEGITINSRSGRIMFPVLEPFGKDLGTKITQLTGNPSIASRFVYTQLYDSTIYRAQEYQEFNRFTIRGSYKSSISSEISLGTFNLPKGSVRVTAAGQLLVEGQDYEIDYGTGRLRVLNDAYLQSGAPINVSFEDNTLFGFQTKTLLGLRADYKLNKDYNIGATWLKLFERPYTRKVNFGDDPINNSIYGLDFNFTKNAPWLTRALDALPLLQTKEASSITFNAEAAAIQPGHSSAIDVNNDGGSVYVDDFEGSVSPISLGNQWTVWSMASVPQDDPDHNNPAFSNTSSLTNDIRQGSNRAMINWYTLFQQNSGSGSIISPDDQNNPYTALISQTEIFPNRQLDQSLLAGNSNQRSFDLAYYPDERGPYNFDIPGGYPGVSAGVAPNGKLLNPETRWAGVMRGLTTTDFEATNIEFIDFWLMDPFIFNKNNGGKLYINLGNVSEDILRDSRPMFENAIRSDSGAVEINETKWSRVPNLIPPTDAFDNITTGLREKQDVGFDGIDNNVERSKFADFLNKSQGLNATALGQLQNDPSNDDFINVNDPSYPSGTSVRQRYFRYNNPQGNSPISVSNSTYSLTKNTPDVEDLNNDKTLNESESYFQYEIPLETDGNELIPNKYLFEKLTTTGKPINYTWYHFRVPIEQFTSKVGSIQDFRSIRFMRMYVAGFQDSVTLRFGTLDLVRNQWRRYRRSLTKNYGEQVPSSDFDATTFDVSSVNIEENSKKYPFNYTLPAGIDREPQLGTLNNILQNEQSLALKVCNLLPEPSGDSIKPNARAIYKIVNMDMRNYKRLRMFVHAETAAGDLVGKIDSGQTSIFMRLGSDFENNYYEYEIPLVISDTMKTSGYIADSKEYVSEVWKAANEFNFPLTLLTTLKEQRNISQASLLTEFSMDDPDRPGNKVRIKGNPNLGLVKGVLVGVSNKDNVPHCLEVWINELRLSGLDERGGVAALARLDMKLADFGNVTVSGNVSTIGFGALDQRLAQRSREEIVGYDLATNLELGKLLPEKSGIKLPFYAQYSTQIRTPQYDPYDLDIELKNKVAQQVDNTSRDSIRKAAQTVETIKGYNFTNVRKERNPENQSKPMPWNIENFSATYAYTNKVRRDPIIENDDVDQYKAGLDYAYQRNVTYIQPLKNVIKKDKYFKYLTDFNFNPLPNSFAFNTLMNRTFAQTKYRFAGNNPYYNTYFNKRFTWDRNYDLQWDFTKTLKFTFNAINTSIIDEPAEFLNDGTRIAKQVRNDSILTNIKNLGRTKNYTHSANLSYNVPLKNIPYLDWVQVRAQVGVNYSWSAASLNTDSLGNVIQNSQTRQINGDLNFETLYNSFKYLKKINTPVSAAAKDKKAKDRKKATSGGADKDKMAAIDGTEGEDMGTSDKAKDRSKKEDKKDDKKSKDFASGKGAAGTIGPDGKPVEASDITADGKSTSKDDKSKDKKEKKGEREISTAERMIIRPLLSLRKAKFTYSENLGTIVPGFMPKSKLLGMQDFNAPGWEFIGGFQPDSKWFDRASQEEWITKNVFFNQQTQKTYNQKISANVTLEPFTDFRVELDASRDFTKNQSEFFDYDQTTGQYVHKTPRDFGSYNITYGALNTLFIDKTNDLKALFNNFQANRKIVSARLGVTEPLPHPQDAGYLYGYGKGQQDVILTSFLATYSGKDPKTFNTDVLKTMPRPNWKLTYGGLAKLSWFKNHVQSFNLTHGYKSTLQVSTFGTDLSNLANTGDPECQDPEFTKNILTQDYYPRYEIPTIVINEQFSPLLGFDLKLKNDFSLKADFKRSRNLALGYSQKELNETKTQEYVVGMGYKFKNVVLPFMKKAQKKKKKNNILDDLLGAKDKEANNPEDKKDKSKKQVGSDLKLQCDFSLRDDVTFLYNIDKPISEPTRGTKTYRLSPSAEYQLNKRLTFRLFLEYNKTIPKTTASFKTTDTRGGLTVRFTL